MCGWDATHLDHAEIKNGCHGDWLAYCASLNKSSQLSSFRSNRFNNLFASAAGLVYHQQDILQFFELRQPSNLKQKSVLADASCQRLNTMLLGLALMYVYITGPFWIFVRSEIHYLDQYTFIQPMHEILKGMSEHPEMILQEGSIPDELNAFCCVICWRWSSKDLLGSLSSLLSGNWPTSFLVESMALHRQNKTDSAWPIAN